MADRKAIHVDRGVERRHFGFLVADVRIGALLHERRCHVVVRVDDRDARAPSLHRDRSGSDRRRAQRVSRPPRALPGAPRTSSGVQLPSGRIDWPLRRRGTSRSRERSLTSAPASTSTLIASVWFSAAAHINAVSPYQFSRAFRSAPCRSRTASTSGLPVRAAVIRTVSPSGSTAFALAPASSRSFRRRQAAVHGSQREWCDALPCGRVHVGAGPKQQPHRLEVVGPDGPVQRGRPVAFCDRRVPPAASAAPARLRGFRP